jgi:pimeloyl-ACP methyl ester carboxylesterase
MIGETINLKDGRKLGYACFGDKTGKPIIYCSGGIGTRLQVLPSQHNPIPLGIRLIGVDRPGLGLSDFLQKRKILDWPEDIVQLVDALGIKSFSVLGVSSGGPYALACAIKLPQRIKKCGLVSSSTPPELGHNSNDMMRTVLWFYRKMPRLTSLWFWWLYARHVGKKDEEIESLLSKPLRVPKMFCETDRKLWNDPDIRRHDLLDHLEAFRQGIKGPVYEAGLWGQPWGFCVEEITLSKVYLWHGEDDLNSPVELVRMMAAKIQDCEAHYYPEYGHSVGSYYWNDILQRINH